MQRLVKKEAFGPFTATLERDIDADGWIVTLACPLMYSDYIGQPWSVRVSNRYVSELWRDALYAAFRAAGKVKFLEG